MTPRNDMMSVLSDEATHHVACERAETFIDRLPDGSVSLLTLDFPYYGVKDDAWDNAWPTPAAFIEWMGGILAKCRRVLAPNGSIYVFTSPEMSGRVECETRRLFSVLSNITWAKPEECKAQKYGPENFRQFVGKSERVLFAERADGPCQAVEYLRAECARLGLSGAQLSGLLGFKESPGSVAPRRYLSVEGFAPVDATAYATLQSKTGGFARPHASLYRPFCLSAAVPFTDVWDYAAVPSYEGRHPCEKPDDMARDMVRASSRPGDVVADFFCGSGKFLAAAVAEGRRAIGCDMDTHWAEQAQRRCDAVKATGRIVRSAPKANVPEQCDLFGRGGQ